MSGLLVCVSFSECQYTMQYSHWDILISVSSWNKGAWCRVCYSCLWTETSKHDTGEPLLFFWRGIFFAAIFIPDLPNSWLVLLYSDGSTGILRVPLWGSPMEHTPGVWCCGVCGVWDDFLLTVSPLLLVKWSHYIQTTANLGHGHDGTCAAVVIYSLSFIHLYDFCCFWCLSLQFSGCYCLAFNLLNPSGYCKNWIILDSTEKDKIKNIEKIYFMVPI